jgi:hypothetical protein
MRAGALLLLAAAGEFAPTHLAAATPPAQAEADLRHLSMEEIRRRLKALDDEQTAALAEDDYDRAVQLLREINRLSGELERRSRRTPVPSPPGAPAPPR